MLTSPDSTFSTTILKRLNLTRQFESFMPDCFIYFMDMAISGTKYFHNVVLQRMEAVMEFLVITLLKIFPRESVS